MLSGKTNVLAAVTCLIIILFLCMACSGRMCYKRVESERRILYLEHWSGGEAPVADIISVYEGGDVILEKYGWKTYCENILPDELEMLMNHIGKEEYDKIINEMAAIECLGCGYGNEEIVIEQGELRIGFIIDDTPEVLQGLFREIDQMYEKYFGGLYSNKLVKGY